MVKAVRNAYNMSIVMTDQCLELLNWSSAEPIYLWLWLVPWRILCLSDCVESLLIYWQLVTIWLIKVICYTYIKIVKNLSDAHEKSLSQTQTKSSTNPHPHKYSDLKLNRFYTLTVCNFKQWINYQHLWHIKCISDCTHTLNGWQNWLHTNRWGVDGIEKWGVL
jgi:hypothetical protein